MTQDNSIIFKLALTGEQVGALIGRNGATISALQKSTSCTIKAGGIGELINIDSRSYRAVSLTGPVSSIRDALLQVTNTLHKDYLDRIEHNIQKSKTYTRDNAEDPNGGSESTNLVPHRLNVPQFTIALLFPESTVGCIIGQKGMNIRSICENTGAVIRFSLPNSNSPIVGERLAKVSGILTTVTSALLELYDTLMVRANEFVYLNPTVVYRNRTRPSLYDPALLPPAHHSFYGMKPPDYPSPYPYPDMPYYDTPPLTYPPYPIRPAQRVLEASPSYPHPAPYDAPTSMTDLVPRMHLRDRGYPVDAAPPASSYTGYACEEPRPVEHSRLFPQTYTHLSDAPPHAPSVSWNPARFEPPIDHHPGPTVKPPFNSQLFPPNHVTDTRSYNRYSPDVNFPIAPNRAEHGISPGQKYFPDGTQSSPFLDGNA